MASRDAQLRRPLHAGRASGPDGVGADRESELQSSGPLGITLGKRRYIVRLEGLRQNAADARVVLSDGTVRQVLYSTDGFVDEPHFYVEWAGDLDRDGASTWL